MTCLPRLLAFLRNPVAGWTAAADELWRDETRTENARLRVELSRALAERDVARSERDTARVQSGRMA